MILSVMLEALFVWIGIDVSKETLDAAIWIEGNRFRWRQFKNNAAGFAALERWAGETAGQAKLGFCLEATSDYHLCAAMYLTERGHHVSVVNPSRIKHFGMALGILTKTDKADAKLIARFAVERSPVAWKLRNPTLRELHRLSRRRAQLLETINMEDNRRECPEAIGQTCRDSIKRILKALRAELRSIEAKIAALLDQAGEFREDIALILSIPALGKHSLATILAEMPSIDDVASAASYAAVAGVQSTSKKSGTRQTDSAPMSKHGNRHVRRALYMPVLTALRKMPEIRAFYDRLRLRGRKHRQAMVACLRKLLMIVYGVLNSRKPYTSKVTGEKPLAST